MAPRIIAILALAATASCLAQQNPYEPTGFPVVSKQMGMPLPYESGQASYELKLLSSEEWTLNANEVVGKKVVFEYRGYRVHADEAIGDLDSQQFSLKGNVEAEGKDETVRGASLFIDFRTRAFRVAEGGVDIRQSFAQGRLLGTLYLNSKEVSGNDRLVTANHLTLTSCEYPDAHYLIESDGMDMEPNHRITFRNLRLRVLGKTLFGVPKLVIPLDQRTATVLPDVGNSADEGAYVRFNWGIPIGKDSLTAMLNLRSKKGVGVGARYSIDRSQQHAVLQAFADAPGSNSPGITASGTYRGKFSWGDIEASQDYRRFSYLTGTDNETWGTRFTFSPSQSPGATTRFSVTNYESRTGTFESKNFTAGISDIRRWGQRLSTKVNATLADLQAFSGVQLNRRRAVDVSFHSEYEGGLYLAELDYNRNVPIGNTVNFSSGLDRTPEFKVRTDRQRLLGKLVPSWVPNFSMSIAAGNYRDNFNAIDVSRYFLDTRVSHSLGTGPGLRFGYDASFRQGIYSDNSAQYTPAAALQLHYSNGGHLEANVRYNYARQHGFSPVQFDRSGQYNLASIDVLAKLLPSLTFGGQVGFDINRQMLGDVAWVSPSMRLEYQPSANLRFRGLATYLPQQNSWGNIRLDLSWRAGGTYFGATARYDALRQVWGNVNVFIDALKWGRLKLSTLLLYNGYLQKFDTRHFALTYDMHCAEAVLQVLENNVGFRPGREILFFVRVKALPFESPFGMGRFGQPLDIGTGVGG